jgi:hypothetical protein
MKSKQPAHLLNRIIAKQPKNPAQDLAQDIVDDPYLMAGYRPASTKYYQD